MALDRALTADHNSRQNAGVNHPCAIIPMVPATAPRINAVVVPVPAHVKRRAYVTGFPIRDVIMVIVMMVTMAMPPVFRVGCCAQQECGSQ